MTLIEKWKKRIAEFTEDDLTIWMIEADLRKVIDNTTAHHGWVDPDELKQKIGLEDVSKDTSEQ